MMQSRNHLKISSAILLLLTAVGFLRTAIVLFFTDPNVVDTVLDGFSQTLLLVVKIFLWVFLLVAILPQIYVGVKGLRIAKTSDTAKGHIVWAYILLVFTVLSWIEPIVTIIRQDASLTDYTPIYGLLLIATLFYYIKSATAVAKENKSHDQKEDL